MVHNTTTTERLDRETNQQLKIGVFSYNFEHKKTQEGLLNLFLYNYDVSCILAADRVDLKFRMSKIRVTPKDLKYVHPKKIAEKFGIPYYVVVHNSKEAESIIKDHKLDLGIILGARILSDSIINSFNVGVLNMHPGLLPENRGLDNIKWAILKNYKQGASCHLISKEIDRGRLVIKEDIEVYEDDTLLDIYMRLQNKEQYLMLNALKALEEGKRNFNEVPEGTYFRSVPEDLEKLLFEKFEKYKKNYRKIQ